MPKLSDTMEEGGIAQWLKKEGDKVKDGDALVEIETDKATLEFSSPESGFLIKILRKPGDAIALDAPICVLGLKDEVFQESMLAGKVDGAKPTPEKEKSAHSATKKDAEPTPKIVSNPISSPIPAGVFVVRMPKLSDTMEEGGIANWLKKEGDKVRDGEPLVEIETDKATLEFAAPESGILLKIVTPKGGGVALDAPICVLGKEGMVFDPSWLAAPPATNTSAAPHASSETQASGVLPLEKKQVQATAPKKSLSISGSTRVKASPLAKKMAEGRGLDLRGLLGSGPNGRVVVRDLDTIGVRGPSSGTFVKTEDKKIPLSMMRKTIAKRLLQGKNEAPHFYLKQSANMSQIMDWREKLNKEREAQKLPRISVNDMIILAVSRALRKHPTVNSSWGGDSILEHGSVHIAMAVALPTGLVTPVIQNTDQLTLSQIASQAKDFGQKAKDGKLTNEDFAGGTFTISNLGMTGIEDFTAIINPPQAAILAVGKTLLQPWVNEQGQIIAQHRMTLTLSCDHRVIDGMVGAKFMESLVAYLETPLLMFG
jgi:pyruvate dehydrogenase E2 component (dihydrolipoamide acetyltransferase)